MTTKVNQPVIVKRIYSPFGKLKTSTPLKFNMEPEKKSLEKVIPFGNHDFQVPC